MLVVWFVCRRDSASTPLTHQHTLALQIKSPQIEVCPELRVTSCSLVYQLSISLFIFHVSSLTLFPFQRLLTTTHFHATLSHYLMRPPSTSPMPLNHHSTRPTSNELRLPPMILQPSNSGYHRTIQTDKPSCLAKSLHKAGLCLLIGGALAGMFLLGMSVPRASPKDIPSSAALGLALQDTFVLADSTEVGVNSKALIEEVSIAICTGPLK